MFNVSVNSSIRRILRSGIDLNQGTLQLILSLESKYRKCLIKLAFDKIGVYNKYIINIYISYKKDTLGHISMYIYIL